MDKNGVFGELLEKGQNTVSNTAKTTASDISNSVQSQVGIKSEQYSATPEDLERTRDMVGEFYAPDNVQTGGLSDDAAGVQIAKDKEELKKLIARQHGETYFEPLVQASVPNEGRGIKEEVQGPDITPKKEMPALGSLGEINPESKGRGKPPSVTDLRRKMAYIEMRTTPG